MGMGMSMGKIMGMNTGKGTMNGMMTTGNNVPTCGTSGIAGTCQDISNGCAGGYLTGKCPGGNNNKCCRTLPTTAAPVTTTTTTMATTTASTTGTSTSGTMTGSSTGTGTGSATTETTGTDTTTATVSDATSNADVASNANSQSAGASSIMNAWFMNAAPSGPSGSSSILNVLMNENSFGGGPGKNANGALIALIVLVILMLFALVGLCAVVIVRRRNVPDAVVVNNGAYRPDARTAANIEVVVFPSERSGTTATMPMPAYTGTIDSGQSHAVAGGELRCAQCRNTYHYQADLDQHTALRHTM